jgi:galactoside O-acetyltransferase
MTLGAPAGAGEYLTDVELRAVGLGNAGTGTRVSRHATLLAPQRISIADDSVVEAFTTLAASEAGLSIGRRVRLQPYVSILGQERVDIEDDVELGMRCSIFSSNDDYSGETLLTPTVDDRFRDSVNAPVRIGRGATLGESSIVLPGVRIGEDAVIAPFSLVTDDIPAGATVGGVPAAFREPAGTAADGIADR